MKSKGLNLLLTKYLSTAGPYNGFFRTQILNSSIGGDIQKGDTANFYCERSLSFQDAELIWYFTAKIYNGRTTELISTDSSGVSFEKYQTINKIEKKIS
jgi:hypothetical protein